MKTNGPVGRKDRSPIIREERSSGMFPGIVFFISFCVVGALAWSQEPVDQSIQAKSADSLFHHIECLLLAAPDDPTIKPEKCGFRYQFEVRRYWNSFSLPQRRVLQSFFSRPKLQTSRLSPSGRFRIHYDTTGINAPALLDNNGARIPSTARAYVDSVASTFDFVWEVETQLLGYPPPPPDKGMGGGNEYDVYILELGRSFYGQTVFEDVVNPRTPNLAYTSFIKIDNDYAGFFSRGVNGLKVTAAHEFHHAIQVGTYGFWEGESYYYEITATWMEDVVYDHVNDYYQYLPYYFNNLSLPFDLSNGFIEYGRALWGKFIEKRFGRDIMKRSWEHMITQKSLPAIDAALRERGTTFVREYSEFSLWHFFTGSQADTLRYFSEGRFYPSVRLADIVSFTPPSSYFSGTARKLSIHFYRILVNRASAQMRGMIPIDTVTIALTNLNLEAAQQGQERSYNFSYRITTEPGDPTYQSLQNGLKYKLLVDDPRNWKSIAFLNSAVKIDEVAAPFPNPFISGRSGGIVFPLDGSHPVKATLNIYSSSFELVYSKVEESRSQYGKPVILWDGRDSKGNFVPSGIYIYLISLPGKELKGKIAVVKE